MTRRDPTVTGNSATFIALILFTYAHVAAALSPAQKEAIDSYIRAKSEIAKELNPILNGIVAEAKARIIAVENVCSAEIPEISERAQALAREIALLDENMRYVNETDFNVYNDPKWRKVMLEQVTRFCCTLRARPRVAERFNQTIRNGAAKRSPRYNGKALPEIKRGLRRGTGGQ